jgi:hypothetical protein
MAAFWSALDKAANAADDSGDGEALDRLPAWLGAALQGALDAALAAFEPLVAARVRRDIADELLTESEHLCAKYRAGDVAFDYVEGCEYASGFVAAGRWVPSAGPTDQPKIAAEE